MNTSYTSVPGLGSVPADAKPVSEALSSVHMSGRWTHHAFRMSHDRKSTIIHHRDGIEVVRGNTRRKLEMDLLAFTPREFIWHPDSTSVAFWAPFEEGHTSGARRVALLEMTRLSGAKPYRIIYDSGESWDEEGVEHVPFGMEWSPTGKVLYVIERLNYTDDPLRGIDTVIVRVELSSGEATEIARKPGSIDFFMPPVSRFEGGQGTSSKPYWLVFGHREGLYLVDPTGRRPPRRVSTLPAVGLENVEWSPTQNQLLLFFKRPARGRDGTTMQGVWLIHLDRVGKAEEEDAAPWKEQLFDGLDVHTLWFSPRGTYVCWATQDGAWFRRADDPREEPTLVETVDADEVYQDVKGVAWHERERHLALATSGGLFVYDVERKRVDRLTDTTAGGGFSAEPVWVGDRIFSTEFVDAAAEIEELKRPKFGTDKGGKRQRRRR